MKNYKNNENNIEKIVNEISYLSERFKDVQNIWLPEKMEDYFFSYYERIKKLFFDSSSQNKNYLKNFVNFWKIFSFNDSDVSENVLFNKIFDKNELYNLKKRLNEKSEIEEKIIFLIIFIIKFIKSFKKELVFIDITEIEEKEIIKKLHFEDNVDWYYKIFKNYLYEGDTDYIDSFEEARHYEGSYWNVVTDQTYMANVRSQERKLEDSWEDAKMRNRKEKIEYFFRNLLIIESLLEKDTFKYLSNNNVYDCLICYPLNQFKKHIDKIVVKLLITFSCSCFINENEISNKIIKEITNDDFYDDFLILQDHIEILY